MLVVPRGPRRVSAVAVLFVKPTRFYDYFSPYPVIHWICHSHTFGLRGDLGLHEAFIDFSFHNYHVSLGLVGCIDWRAGNDLVAC